MTTNSSDRTVQAALARLAREHPDLTDVDRRLVDAFERLMLDRPEITDGRITVANICTEAGVSRASYYRSPVAEAVKQVLNTPTVQRPEVEELRAEVTRLKAAERALRQEKAAEIRELTDTVNTYANRIQVLALHNAELQDELQRLQRRLADYDDKIRSLPRRG
jgi:FtsZ-binding cell division protein ZapB